MTVVIKTVRDYVWWDVFPKISLQLIFFKGKYGHLLGALLSETVPVRIYSAR